MTDRAETELAHLALHDLHEAQGGRMVPFAGYAMPVHYAGGVMAEHLHCRTAAGLFDVSHMGQVLLRPLPVATMDDVARGFEGLVPVDVAGLLPGRQRYAMLTDAGGGILDDLMIANRGEDFFVVVNAACKAADIAHMTAHLAQVCEVVTVTDRCLLALQGPAAGDAMARLVPEVAAMRFMDVTAIDTAFGPLWISRSGYTGEDGFEVSVLNESAGALATALLALPDVALIGLGARDSLRLEAGLCLYGHDIDTTTTPVEAGLTWAIQKVRRPGGARAGGYPGADRIGTDLADGPGRIRVGLLPQGRAPMREGTPLFASHAPDAPRVGHVTSGGYGPTLGAPLAMGYVAIGVSAPQTILYGEVRGKRMPVAVAPLPFVPARFKR